MIIRETPSGFIFVKQHDHAAISGVFAQNWQPTYFPGTEKMDSIIYAIFQHDRGWINLDDTPFWNDKMEMPYSFIQMPEGTKVTHYKVGIDEVAETDAYAALLCSLHYSAFLDLAKHAAGHAFLLAEAQRQEKLKEDFGINTPEKEQALADQVQMLKFCDSLSIYLCINQPGISKEAEHIWYRNGIPNSNQFSFTQGKHIQASWISTDQIIVAPFPFVQDFSITLKQKEVTKEAIEKIGLADAYHQAPYQEHTILISA